MPLPRGRATQAYICAATSSRFGSQRIWTATATVVAVAADDSLGFISDKAMDLLLDLSWSGFASRFNDPVLAWNATFEGAIRFTSVLAIYIFDKLTADQHSCRQLEERVRLRKNRLSM